MVLRLKTLCRILVRYRFLLSGGLSAAARIILKSIVLISTVDPIFRYAGLQRPGIYDAFVWSFAIFLFTTPFLMLSMCFSLLYIHFYEEEAARRNSPRPHRPGVGPSLRLLSGLHKVFGVLSPNQRARNTLYQRG